MVVVDNGRILCFVVTVTLNILLSHATAAECFELNNKKLDDD